MHINHICLCNSPIFPSLSHMWPPLSNFHNIAVTGLLTEPIWQIRSSDVEYPHRLGLWSVLVFLFFLRFY
jgi:hypothetical protein